MKRLSVLLCCVLLLSACSSMRRKPVPAWTPVSAKAPADKQMATGSAEKPMAEANGVAIEVVPFRPGVSSTTVERMAKAAGCVGGKGAGLLTPQGPIEVYRMQCDNGSTFKARCDMRQCKPMTGPNEVGLNAPAAQPAGAAPAVAQAAPAVAAAVPVEAEVVATVAAPAVAAAPGAGAGRALSRGELPKLVVHWNCGDCKPSDKVLAKLTEVYAAQARQNGLTVSDSETAELSITKFHQRSPALRVLFGVMAGTDVLNGRVTYRNAGFDVGDYMANAMWGIDKICENVATQTVSQLRTQ